MKLLRNRRDGEGTAVAPLPRLLQRLPFTPAALASFGVAAGLLEYAGWKYGSVALWAAAKAMALLLLAAWCAGHSGRIRRERDLARASRADLEGMWQGAFDSLNGHVALLAEDGTVVAVNRAWREFAAANGGTLARCGVGENYLKACVADAGEQANEVLAAMRGFFKVLSGEQPEFRAEYPCFGPEGDRWFQVHATRLSRSERRWLVLSHVEITQGKQAELEVQRLHRDQFEQARRDSLTGLGNRLRLQEDLEVMQARQERYGHAYSIVLCDIDLFKSYNDRYGYNRGDEVLQKVSETILAHCRKGDTAYRYGGEEFILILPEQSAEEATIAAERIRRAVEEMEISHLLNPPAGIVTISAGVSSVARGGCKSVEVLLEEADDALYVSKQGGRNRVRTYQPLTFELQTV